MMKGFQLGIKESLLVMLKIGVLLYFANFFLLSSSKQNTNLYILAFLPWLLLLPFTAKELLTKHIVVHALLLGIIYYCLSTFWSSDSGSSFLKASRYALYIFVFTTSIHILIKNNKLPVNHIIAVIFIAALISGTLTLFQQWESIGHGRLVHSIFLDSTRNNPINTAVFFGLASLFSIHIFRTTAQTRYRVASLLAFILFVGVVLLTKSRGPAIALGLTIPMLFIFIQGRSKTLDRIQIASIFLVIGGALFFFYDDASQRLSQPNYRFEIWAAALKQLQGNLFFGTGLNFDDHVNISDGYSFTHSHNSFLQLLVTGGVVGAGVFLSVILFALITAWRSSNAAIKLYALWLIYGCICLSSNGKLIITRPSTLWFSFWVPLTLILYTHINSLDDSKYHHFLSFKHYLKWQRNKPPFKHLLNQLSDLWMSLIAWFLSLNPKNIAKEPCDILFLRRRKNSDQNINLVALLSKERCVKATYQSKRSQIIKDRKIAHLTWLTPAVHYIYASYASFLVLKYKPKIIITFANGTPLTPFLRAAMNKTNGYVIHMAHSIPTNNYRKFSLIDFDYYFLYGESSIDKLKRKQRLFGTTSCIKTGSRLIEERLQYSKRDYKNPAEKAILLLGCGPTIELKKNTEHVYQLIINWVLAHPEFKLYFKPHPRSTTKLWLQLVSDQKSSAFELIDKLNNDVSHCFAAIAPYTNAVLDVSLLGIPPLWVATKNDTDEFLCEEFFGKRALNDQQLSEKLNNYIENPSFYKEKTTPFANYHISQPTQGATKFTAALIGKILRGDIESIKMTVVSAPPSY